MFHNQIAIDLGTANILVIYGNEIAINEPSIIALDSLNPQKVLAIGKQALLMHEKTHRNIRTVRPLKDGVIADFSAAELLIRETVKKLSVRKRFFFSMWSMLIAVPTNITEVEKRAVVDSAELAGARQVKLIYESMAAAIGMGLNVEAPEGIMVVDIGGGTTGISVIALGGIVCDESIRVAGDELTIAILDYVKTNYGLIIGERTAEHIKINIGAAVDKLDEPPNDVPVYGRDIVTGIPKQIILSYKEVSIALNETIEKIERAIVSALENTPPELAADIFRNGIHLTGGGALIRGIDKRINKKVKIPIHIAKDPLKSVVKGTAIAMSDYPNAPFIF